MSSNNAYMREYMLRRYHERIAEAKERLGGVCVVCGTSERLEIDHVDWREKRIRLSKLWSISKTQYDEELTRCQLLCHEHHKEKSKVDVVEWGSEQRRVCCGREFVSHVAYAGHKRWCRAADATG